jgi:hypothetical protein
LGVTTKWIDNVLSHYVVPGVTSARQGVERTVSDLAIRILELARIANQDLGVPMARAVAIAAAATGPDSRFVSPSGVELRFPLESIERRLRERLMDAIEATPRVPRGRPRKKV